ncbi:D-glucuronyl C5-epimerase B [Exaiptasia diaphana]|uniref:heparosan-N-sulfate-glucuronate 5-epimerase n=1 Tax=Exaiptasia diaphana TaxID=2652724 RepID=A0A913XDS4_EXADI|nr:D-glucuronyl C5-epimerase B [Exaiptasia diaphana]
MRLSYCLCGRITAKLFLVCVLISLTTWYVSWSNCPKASPLSTIPKEDDQSNPDPQIYCADLVSAALREREDQEYADRKEREEKIRDNCPKSVPYETIDVIVNGGEKKIEGRIDLDKNEPYVPFSFVKNYFEIYGGMQKFDKHRILEWRHSYSEIHETKHKYDPKGAFLWFQGYHVEGRQRVLCISGKEEVPVSSQWNPKGHFYPIQIAQYGLSHYSMMQVEGKSRGKTRIFEDAEAEDHNWIANDPNEVQAVYDKERETRVIQFFTPELDGEGISLHIDSSNKEYVLSFDLKILDSGRVAVTLETNNIKQHVINYSTDNKLIEVKNNAIFMGLGNQDGWRRITRNLDTDLRKGLKLMDSKFKKSNIKVVITEIQSIVVYGKGLIDNVTLSRTARLDFFMAAADWFVRNQNDNGGWPITVKRKILEGVEIKPGWYSAMAQGQGMSLLTRAYYHTKNISYLNAALKATSVFKISSEDNGVRATFMDKYHWYEEYPTTPSLYVLNGFIYSLLGLYDLTLAAPAEQREEAAVLFRDGMRSLRNMLLMFDAGSGTFYDLRHISMRAAPNLARWDYHTLHVSLLMFLTSSGIDNDPIFKATSARWAGYTKGKRAKHN